jgi:hypothetical protein
MAKSLLNSLYGRFSLKLSIENSNYISAAVSSYARVEIYQYKFLYRYIYSDTDSIFTYGSLNKKYLGKKIGLMKLEDEIQVIKIFKEKAYMYKSKKPQIIKGSGFLKYILNENRTKNKLTLGFLKLKNFYMATKELKYSNFTKVKKKLYVKNPTNLFPDFLTFF